LLAPNARTSPAPHERDRGRRAPPATPPSHPNDEGKAGRSPQAEPLQARPNALGDVRRLIRRQNFVWQQSRNRRRDGAKPSIGDDALGSALRVGGSGVEKDNPRAQAWSSRRWEAASSISRPNVTQPSPIRLARRPAETHDGRLHIIACVQLLFGVFHRMRAAKTELSEPYFMHFVKS